MTKFVNLTPHVVKIVGSEGNEVLSIPPSGVVARVKAIDTQVGVEAGVPLFETTYGEIEGLPEVIEDGVLYIVSGLLKSALKAKGTEGRFVSPAGLVRDENGRVIGCRGLSL